MSHEYDELHQMIESLRKTRRELIVIGLEGMWLCFQYRARQIARGNWSVDEDWTQEWNKFYSTFKENAMKEFQTMEVKTRLEIAFIQARINRLCKVKIFK